MRPVLLHLTPSELPEALRFVRIARERVQHGTSYICHALPPGRLGTKLRDAVMECLKKPAYKNNWGGETQQFYTFESYYGMPYGKYAKPEVAKALRLKFLDAWIKAIKRAMRS